ncbi:hypothetical protein CBR_g19522 [Chara braunii]|uniref:ABC transporter domain-containing protein n=1 Tax=Chara braunii TaxID=69332 RepID=A0A388KYB4_CHABU|nr:hypothetical protein CBR_g19522 [Chara braunii]|eukprot:GBG75008.1 hypothetical protein CBR_g19522 [Chara braunii]
MVEEECGDVFGTVRGRARDEVGMFGQAADNDVDAIMPAVSLEEAAHEVHGDGLPPIAELVVNGGEVWAGQIALGVSMMKRWKELNMGHGGVDFLGGLVVGSSREGIGNAVAFAGVGLQFKEPLTNYHERPMLLVLKNCSEVAPLLALAAENGSVVGADNESSIVFVLPTQPSFVGAPLPDIPENRRMIPLLVRCLSANVTYFASSSEVNKRVFQSYKVTDEGVPLALDFRNTSRTHLDVNIWFNETLTAFSFGQWPKRQLRLPRSLNAVTNAFLRWATNKSEVYAPMLYVKDMPKPETNLNLDISSGIGPLFFCWVLHLLLPVTVFNLVYEKEKNLRMMMKMHGLGDNAYWVISYGYFFVISILYNGLFLAAASAIRLNFFIRNDYSVQVVFFFLVANNIIALSFLITPLFSSVKTAMVVSYLYVFGMGLLGEFVIRNFWEDVTLTPWLLRCIQIVPAWAIYRGLLELGAYASIAKYEGSRGLSWDRMSEPYNGMDEVMYTLLVEWFVFLLLALYLDKVVVTGSGVKRHPLFFLKYFWRRWGDKGADGKRVPLMSLPGDAQQDVLEERAAVELALNDPKGYSIVCDHLRKVYPGVDGNPEKVAVRELSLAVRRGECFGMLGPNGAGKTTSINMMIGFLSPSSGNALIEGLSIDDDVDMIYSLMGVCPQHDLLWESLTAREHLWFFGRLKNLKGQELKDAVDASLKNVDLHHATVADRFAGKYSGGMKRRLSVAISLIGDPLVVYMDEPSTGLDPASRNNLWKVVKAAKKNRAIILTTHSMEEAEALCDRIGIVVDGEFQCIGAPKELTARYGGTFVFTISTPVSQEAEVQDLVISLSPNVRKIYGIGGTQKFEMPVGDVKIADVFARVEAAKKRLTIHAWGIANTTLEDVFIRVAKEAGNVM